jgi:undecaprenyl-diphosphatase
MSVVQALVLGLVQGLTELLPVSSSAHLLLTPWLLGWDRRQSLAFDVALHCGTMVAILGYFRREWLALTRAALALALATRRRTTTADERRVLHLVLGTIPAVFAGLLVGPYAATVFRDQRLMTATALVALGVLLWVVDRRAGADRTLERMRMRDALLIGLAQCLALVPGVSRSGSTMTVGRALRFRREEAAVFSFLLSLPITLGAVVREGPQALRESGGLSAPLVVGMVAAGASSWLAAAVLLRWVQHRSFAVFAGYRVLLGLVVLGLVLARG